MDKSEKKKEENKSTGSSDDEQKSQRRTRGSWELLFKPKEQEGEGVLTAEHQECKKEVQDPNSYYDFYFNGDDEIINAIEFPHEYTYESPQKDSKTGAQLLIGHQQSREESCLATSPLIQAPGRTGKSIEITAPPKVSIVSVYCGNCSMLVGSSDVVTEQFVSERTEERNIFYKSNVYKCLVCQTVGIRMSVLSSHVLEHCKNGNVFCKQCKVELKLQKCSYELELLDLSEIMSYTNDQEEPAKSECNEESSDIETKEDELLSCGRCGNFFGNASKIMSKLIQTSRGIYVMKETTTDYFCLICKQHSMYDDWFKTHILKHFRLREIYCDPCRHQQATLVHAAPDEKRFSRFVPSQIETIDSHIVRCGKCEVYLADYSTLVMKRFAGGVNKEEFSKSGSPKEPNYECLICSAERRSALMEKHVQRHVSSNDIICYRCQQTHTKVYACSLRRIVHRLDKILALGSSSYDICQKCQREFNRANAIVEMVDMFLLKEKKKKDYVKERVIFTCLLCQKSYNCSDFIIKHILSHSPDEKLLCWDCNMEEAIHTT